MDNTTNERERKKLQDNLDKLSEVIEVLSIEKKGMEDDMSLVHIYFKELGVVQYSRDQLYSIIDVIGEKKKCGFKKEKIA